MDLLKRKKLYPDLWKYEDTTKLKIMCKKVWVCILEFGMAMEKNIWTPDVECECEQNIPGTPTASANAWI